MSLDFYLVKVLPTNVYSRNITHNVGAMWTQAGVRDALYNSEGLKASEVLRVLRSGLSLMKKYPNKFKALNPENGWGNYEGALAFLTSVIAACEEDPDAIIHISK